MDYATAYEVFFQPAPPDTPLPKPVENGSPARRLRDAVEPLATHPYWARLVNERLAERGLNFLSGYLWGRAAPQVASSTGGGGSVCGVRAGADRELVRGWAACHRAG
jgi:hypothetical protein